VRYETAHQGFAQEGDSAFFRGIHEYYRVYRDSTSSLTP